VIGIRIRRYEGESGLAPSPSPWPLILLYVLHHIEIGIFSSFWSFCLMKHRSSNMINIPSIFYVQGGQYSELSQCPGRGCSRCYRATSIPSLMKIKGLTYIWRNFYLNAPSSESKIANAFIFVSFPLLYNRQKQPSAVWDNDQYYYKRDIRIVLLYMSCSTNKSFWYSHRLFLHSMLVESTACYCIERHRIESRNSSNPLEWKR
jgi:hypothetical protein